MESYNNLELSREWKLLKSMEKTTYAYRVDTSNKPKKNYNIMQKWKQNSVVRKISFHKNK